MEQTHVDLRGLPVWERPNVIFEAFDRLPSGGAMMFVTENEPRGLSERIVQARRFELRIESRRMGEREWHVTLTRTKLEDRASGTLDALARCSPFAALGDEDLERLSAVASAHVFRRGQTIVNEDGEWPFIGIVTEGVLALSNGTNGQRERIFYEIFPHEIFGETEFFDRAPAVGRVAVLSKSARFVKIPRDVVMAVGTREPRLLVALAEVCAQRVRGLSEALSAQATTPILARVAQVLLPYALPEEGMSPAVPTLASVTQAQIAASAGTVKEVAARAIAELEGRNLLRRERGHVRFLNRQGLVDLVRELT